MKFLVILIIFKACVMQAPLKLKEVFVYEHFPARGYTTAGLSTELKDLREKKVQKTSLDTHDIIILQDILNSSKANKHVQTKTGVGPVFCQAISDSQTIEIVIFKNLIIDMSDYVNYWIENEKHKQLLSEFITRVKKDKNFEGTSR